MKWKQIPNESWLGQKQAGVSLLAVYERNDTYEGCPFTPYKELEEFVKGHKAAAESLGGKLMYTMGAPGSEKLLAVKAWVKENKYE